MCGAMLRVDADLELTFAQKERCLLTEEFLQIAGHAKKFYIIFSKIMEIYCPDKYS